MVLAGTFLFIMNYYNYRMLAKEEKERKEMEEKTKDNKHTRTETEDGNSWDKEKMQDGPEVEPLREEQEGLKKEVNGLSEV